MKPTTQAPKPRPKVKSPLMPDAIALLGEIQRKAGGPVSAEDIYRHVRAMGAPPEMKAAAENSQQEILIITAHAVTFRERDLAGAKTPDEARAMLLGMVDDDASPIYQEFCQDWEEAFHQFPEQDPRVATAVDEEEGGGD